MKVSFILFYLLVAATFTACKTMVNPSLVIARQGQMDLSTWDIQKKGSLSLDGEWEFYFQRLLTPTDFSTLSGLQPDTFAVVPGNWKDITLHSKKIGGQGFATYRLRIKNCSYKGAMALRIRDAGSSYRIWVNDELIAENGKVSGEAGKAVAQFLPLVRPFNNSSDSFQVIVQVANFFHSEGGLWKSIELGEFSQTLSQRDTERTAELLLSGAMFILFVYHIFIFGLRRKEYASLWFALLCLDSTLRTLLTGERIIYSMLPGLSLYTGFRAEYMTITLGIPVYSIMAYEFFRKEWSVTIRNIIVITGLVESMLICFLPPRIFSHFLTYMQGVVVLECFYLIYIVIRAVMHKLDFALISFISYCFLFAAILHDILVTQFLLSGGFILYYVFIGVRIA